MTTGEQALYADLRAFVKRMDTYAKGSYSGATLYPDEAAYVVMTMVPMLVEKLAAFEAAKGASS